MKMATSPMAPVEDMTTTCRNVDPEVKAGPEFEGVGDFDKEWLLLFEACTNTSANPLHCNLFLMELAQAPIKTVFE